MPKKENIEQLFDNIAPSYDRLNHVLSLNVDRSWRRKAVKEVVDCKKALRILDVACGTGDLTVALARALLKKNDDGWHNVPSQYRADKGSLAWRIAADCGAWSRPGSVEGIDLSENMLKICREKISEARLWETIRVRQGDGEHLPYEDNSFDRVTIAFGIRNFEHIDLGLSEMRRVLKPGGKAVILELSMPQNRFVAWLYKFYFTKILPVIGGKASGDKASYSYLPASVIHFPAPDAFCSMMREAGFTDIRHKALSLGISRLFIGRKDK